ncbi:MAG TPA: hypothetical protein VML01_02265 [Bryobacterales bacterium]|nr:hypothetical protein [Bryobacterales bacterium]
MTPPRWALLERELLRANSEAVEFFADRYIDERGYLLHTPRWGTLDGPDDVHLPPQHVDVTLVAGEQNLDFLALRPKRRQCHAQACMATQFPAHPATAALRPFAHQ